MNASRFFFNLKNKKNQNCLSNIGFIAVFSHQSFRLLLSESFLREIFLSSFKFHIMTLGIIL